MSEELPQLTTAGSSAAPPSAALPADYPRADSITWEHIGSWRFLLVIGRALILQLAHPAVGAGVIEHSTYRAHPWRRAEHTLDSLQRLCYADTEAVQREIGRIARQHHRIKGVDAAGRSYTAEDPSSRVWVLATIPDGIIKLRELSGRPFSRAEEEQVLREWRAIGIALGLPAEAMPVASFEFRRYFDATVSCVLEDNAAVREMLGPFYRHAAAPKQLRWAPGLWVLIRPLVARLMVALIVADLPLALRERLGLKVTRRARVWAWTVHHGMRHLVRLLPKRRRLLPYASAAWKRAAEERRGDGDGRHVAEPTGFLRRDLRARKLRQLFAHVLDQNGDGLLTWTDLQAMARAAAWETELDTVLEERLFDGFGAWWRQLCDGSGTAPDAGMTADTFVTATLAGLDDDPDYLAAGLDQATAAWFDAIDADRDGHLGLDDYHRAFGGHAHPAELNHGFRQLDRDGDGRIGKPEFVAGLRDFFTARGKSAAGSHLLGQP